MLQTNFTYSPILETSRLILRQLELSDAPEMYLYRSDEEIMKYIGRPRAKSIEDAAELIQRISTSIANGEAINWGITLKGNDKVIGSIGFVRFKKDAFRAEIGYLLSTEYHRQGIMDEAIKEVIRFGFHDIGLHSIEAIVDPLNIGSMSILEKNNFRREAYFREDFYFNGKFLDSVVYGLLEGDV